MKISHKIINVITYTYVMLGALLRSVLTERLRAAADAAAEDSRILDVGGAEDLSPAPALYSELLLDELLIEPSSCFCLAGSSEVRRLSAWSRKCSANAQNALHTIHTR